MAANMLRGRDFGWGHEGREARLLAEAILALFNPPEVAVDRARWFVAAHVSRWPRGDFEVQIPDRTLMLTPVAS
jgi:hypothetical protein